MCSLLKLLFLFHVVYGFVSPQCHSKNRHLSLVLDKDRSYCEKPFHFLSVEDLVFYYGDRENWWGDTNAQETRSLYHKLLPIYYPSYFSVYNMETLAFKTYQTRKAVKQYVRRRSHFYVRWLSVLIDSIHNLKQYKRWRPLGATYEELWEKYRKKIISNDPFISQEELNKKIVSTILMKSCHTNEWVDLLLT